MELPNVTLAEVAVFGAAILTFYVAPTFLAWGDARRQRRLQRERVALEAAAAAVSVTPVDEPSLPLGVVESAVVEGAPAFGAAATSESEFVAPPTQALPVEPTYAPPSVEAATSGEVEASVPEPLHIVRLADVRQVQLADWPPAAVRDDPARRQAWLDGERLAAADMARVATVCLESPVPVASACLASTGTDGSHRIFRYFLFSALWPASAADAVAEAEFQLDPTSGTVTGRVLPPSGR